MTDTSQFAPTGRGFGSRLAALLLVAAMVLGACGDSESDDGAGSGSSNDSAGAIPGEKNPATGTPVKVGFVTAEGGAAVSLPETREAAEAAVKYANEYLGGLNGHRIELHVCKDKSDGASATACANEMVQQKVVAVTVGQVSNPDLYIPVLEGAGIPWVHLSAVGNKALTSSIGFNITGGFVGTLGALAAEANEKGYKKVVFLGVDVPVFTGAFNSLGKPAFQRASVDAEVIGIPPGTPDATSQVAAAMAKKPDLIVIVVDPALCKALLPPLRTMNTGKIPMVSSDTCSDPDVISSVGKDAIEGMTIYNVSASLGDDEEGKLYKAVMAQYAPSTSPQGKAGVGYGSVLSLVRGINQVKPTGELTAATIVQAMRATKDVPTPGQPGGKFTCNSTAFPMLKSMCSTMVLFATIDNATLVDYRVLDGSKYLKAS